MSYQSFAFFLFCGAVILLYYMVGRKGQKWVLAAANLTFYASAGIQYLPFLLVTLCATFFAGKKIGKIYQTADEQIALCETPAEKKVLRNTAKVKAKRFLLVGMLVTIALLAVCKYTIFVLTNVNSLLATFQAPQITLFKMILPLGISFYSFMALSYVLDIYWKRYKAENNFLTYAVYLSYFPHVVQGPIDRFNEFKAQTQEGVAFDFATVTQGLQLSLWGLFKKLVIADRLGLFVNEVFKKWDTSSGAILVIAVLVYSIQIYADFSGCIDIVTGVSETLGIKLRKNFNHPYFSKTMGEFWRRWHISLQEWFKDYVYYPVSASSLLRKAKKSLKDSRIPRASELFASCFPVLVVWLITGIWHGADWKFVVWGLFHASLLIGSQLFDPLFKMLPAKLKIDTENFGWRFWQMTRTFLLCGVGRIFFRADTVEDGFGILGRMFSEFDLSALFDKSLKYGLDEPNRFIAVLAVIVLWCVDLLQEKMPIRKTLAKQNIVFRWVLIFVALFTVIIFGIYGPGFDASNFIYEQF